MIWELSGSDAGRERRALRLIGISFLLLAAYLVAQTAFVLAVATTPHIARSGSRTAATALVMFALAAAKHAPGVPSTITPCRPRGA